VVKAFYGLRQIDDLRKKPSTGELIDWLRRLIAAGVPHDSVSRDLAFIGTVAQERDRLSSTCEDPP